MTSSFQQNDKRRKLLYDSGHQSTAKLFGFLISMIPVAVFIGEMAYPETPVLLWFMLVLPVAVAMWFWVVSFIRCSVPYPCRLFDCGDHLLVEQYNAKWSEKIPLSNIADLDYDLKIERGNAPDLHHERTILTLLKPGRRLPRKLVFSLRIPRERQKEVLRGSGIWTELVAPPSCYLELRRILDEYRKNQEQGA
ncbi:MAG: hypothetical protein LBF51_03630 [Zoogloeaceae bacterium]|jgi:hypothetical protein|nr:hypothetical protein [Zoogloeaceae bacterium]